MIAARHSSALCRSAHRLGGDVGARSTEGEPPPAWRRTAAFIGWPPPLADEQPRQGTV